MKKEQKPWDHAPSRWTLYGRWDNEGLKCYGKDPDVPIVDYSRGYALERKIKFEETE